METIHTVHVEDKTRIKSIEFKFPELVSKDAEQLIKKEYYELIATRNELQHAREEVRRLEKLYNTLFQEWEAKRDLFDIEFESTEKEVKTTKSYMTINGKTVYDCNSRR